MFTVLVIMKNAASANRLINSFQEDKIEWKQEVNSFEELQEELITSNFDLIVLDEKFYWVEEAEELISRQNMDLVKFVGDFEKVHEEIKTYLDSYVKEEYNLQNITEKNNEGQAPQIKYIIQEKEVIQEKIIYKSKNIRQKLYGIVTNDNNMIRDFYACNVGALLGSNRIEKTIIVDITNNNSIIEYLNISKEKQEEIQKGINPYSIKKCVDYIHDNENLNLLRLDIRKVNKKYIKMILFALRDYENIIFVIDNDLSFIPNQYILSIVNEVHLIIEPTIPTVRNSLNYIKLINHLGQIDENINIILADNLGDIDVWKSLFAKYSFYMITRSIYINSVNDESLVLAKKEIEVLKNILKIENKSKGILNIFRR